MPARKAPRRVSAPVAAAKVKPRARPRPAARPCRAAPRALAPRFSAWFWLARPSRVAVARPEKRNGAAVVLQRRSLVLASAQRKVTSLVGLWRHAQVRAERVVALGEALLDLFGVLNG